MDRPSSCGIGQQVTTASNGRHLHCFTPLSCPSGRYLGSPWDLGPHICCSCKGSSWHGLQFTIFSPPWAASIHPQKVHNLDRQCQQCTLMLHFRWMCFNPSDACLHFRGIRTGIRGISRQDFSSVHVPSHPRLYALASPNHGISMGCGTGGTAVLLHGLGDQNEAPFVSAPPSTKAAGISLSLSPYIYKIL